jgi:hypothetical protein
MVGFLLKTKIDTSLESVFGDLHIYPTIGVVFSNGAELIFQSQTSWSSTSLGFVYSLENKFVVSGPENDRLFIKNEN